MKVESVTFDLKVVFTFIGTSGKSAYLKCVFSVTSEYVKEPLIRKYVIKQPHVYKPIFIFNTIRKDVCV